MLILNLFNTFKTAEEEKKKKKKLEEEQSDYRLFVSSNKEDDPLCEKQKNKSILKQDYNIKKG